MEPDEVIDLIEKLREIIINYKEDTK